MNIKSIRLIGIFLSVGVLLLIPFIAMKFTSEVNWNWFDFAVAGTLLLGTGLICEFVLRRFKSVGQRVVICGAVLLGLFVVGAELAVGIIGTPLAGN